MHALTRLVCAYCQTLVFLAVLAAPSLVTAADAKYEMVIVEQPGCHFCIRWHEEIGPAYPKTALGAFAPLRSEQLRDTPADLTYARRVLFTPTFILVDEAGTEVARLEGYPGQDFFWPMIEQLAADTVGFVPETLGEN